MTTDRGSGAALLLVALAVAWETRRLPLGTHQGPGPGYFPLFLAALLALLAVLIVARGRAAPRLGALSWGEVPHALAILGAAGVAALALERRGVVRSEGHATRDDAAAARRPPPGGRGPGVQGGDGQA